ncbi:hypothetical protein NXS19_011186 [Fusarium pseudograminearum]|nr:hypothetical protein NXS19_011186 [Fusarium pseudograminearum]
MASIEVNDILFCQEHFAEVCDECCVDLREENDSFYGFDSRDRDALTCPPVTVNNDGEVVCNEHDSATCSQCFN